MMFDRWQDPLVLTSVGGMCPTQAEGVFYGFPFYFRARHGEWTLSISLPGTDPVDTAPVYYAEGEDDTCGYMESGDVVAILGLHWKRFMEAEIHLAGYAYECEPWRPASSASAAQR